MKLFSFFKKDDDKKYNINEINSNKKLFIQVINDAKYILKESTNNTEEIHPIFTFIKQFTDLITHEAAINSYINGDYHPDHTIPIIFEGRICPRINPEIKYIKIAEEKNWLLENMDNYFIYNKDIPMDLSVFPLILNPWNSGRISNNILHLATDSNPFDKDKYSYNINNYYYYPIGVGQCFGGNHSQYSSKLKGKGTTSINIITDVSEVYKLVSFDGCKFYCGNSAKSNNEIKLEVFDCNDRLEFYSGLLFEIGRLLLDYPEIFPEKIQETISSSFT